MADQDITKMKVADLRKELKNRGLNLVGNKQELMDRLQAALLEDGNLEDSTLNDLDDDILNDDDLEEEKSLLDSTHDDILKSPSESVKSESPETPKETVKKISLKRNLSITTPIIENKLTTVQDNGSTVISNSEPDKKVIKLSTLTALERLELRAKKFGAKSDTKASPVVVSSSASKEARAARFGITSPDNSSSKITNDITPTSLEVLKKRAERFGTAVASDLKKVELDEKLQKRQERFGITATAVPATAATAPIKIAPSANDYAEKARMRAERFKTAA